MVSVTFHAVAQAEYDDTLAWYADRDPGAADGFKAEVRRAIEMMAEFPELGPPVDKRHRCWLLRKYPYELVYRYSGSAILLVAVAHTSQKPGFWNKRA